MPRRRSPASPTPRRRAARPGPPRCSASSRPRRAPRSRATSGGRRPRAAPEPPAPRHRRHGSGLDRSAGPRGAASQEVGSAPDAPPTAAQLLRKGHASALLVPDAGAGPLNVSGPHRDPSPLRAHCAGAPRPSRRSRGGAHRRRPAPPRGLRPRPDRLLRGRRLRGPGAGPARLRPQLRCRQLRGRGGRLGLRPDAAGLQPLLRPPHRRSSASGSSSPSASTSSPSAAASPGSRRATSSCSSCAASAASARRCSRCRRPRCC